MVGRPDIQGREEILKVHAKGKPLSEDVDLKQVAQTTAGFTGADLENLLNEAAIMAAKGRKVYIQQSDIRHAFVKSVSEQRRRVESFRIRRRGLQHSMRQDMQSYSMCSRMSDRYIVFLSFQPELGQRDIRCRFRRKMMCSIQEER